MTAGVEQSTRREATSLVEQLLSAVGRVRTLLDGEPSTSSEKDTVPAAEAIPDRRSSPLSKLVDRFELSSFEQSVLLFCVAVELDPEIPALLELAHGISGMRQPTFHLLLNILPEAQWSSLLPRGALRRWHFIEVGASETLTTAPLRIDENVLHFLIGGKTSDARLEGALQRVSVPKILPHSYRAHTERMLRLWTSNPGNRTVVQLAGNGGKGKLALAAASCAAAGLTLRSLSPEYIPSRGAEREQFIRLLERDSTLNEYALLLDAEGADPSAWDAISNCADRFEGILLVSGTGPLRPKSGEVLTLLVEKPTAEEQLSLWQYALGKKGQELNGDLSRLSEQFSLNLAVILSSASKVLRDLEFSPGDLASRLWEACRNESRHALEGLARRIETKSHWNDIALPDGCLETLHTIVFQMRQRSTVLDRWGFAARTSRGLGTAALFCGPSGSGKTLAAEILANELSLDLFHIDLSQIVSKYIGETEKNLRCIFDAAEDTGAILLFDEADALFGKRSEVRDSHDRYANIEVSYLLQRMETYRGLAILTTNLRGALDSAFLRRIRFVVQFPFPDANLRRQIWERMFPAGAPVEHLRFDKLARLNLPGGNIRNIALNAAYIAAEKSEPVRMCHLLSAARQECNKLERPLNESEIGGWV